MLQVIRESVYSCLFVSIRVYFFRNGRAIRSIRTVSCLSVSNRRRVYFSECVYFFVSIRVYPCLIHVYPCLSVSISCLCVSIRVYLYMSIRVYPCLSSAYNACLLADIAQQLIMRSFGYPVPGPFAVVRQ